MAVVFPVPQILMSQLNGLCYAGPVVCKADSQPVMAAAAAVPALLASHPALAVVS